jgi:hypothetical protein
MTNPQSPRRGLVNTDRQRIDRALKIASTGCAALLFTKEGICFVCNMSSELSARRVHQWVADDPSILVGFYTQRFGMKSAELRRLMVEDLAFVGAI